MRLPSPALLGIDSLLTFVHILRMRAVRIFLILALSFAGGLAFRHMKRKPDFRAPKPTVLCEQSAQTPATRPKEPSFSWMNLEAVNLVQFRENLRAIGCPDETIEDLIVARVSRQFDERLKDARGTTNFWETRTPLWLTGRTDGVLVNQIELEKAAFLQQALGINYFEYKDRHTYPSTFVEDVRDDKTLREFRDALYGWDVTKAEFDALYAAHKSYLGAVRALQSEDPGRFAKYRGAGDQNNERVRAAIGDERFAEYQRIKDMRYSALKILSLNGDLSPEAVEQAYALIKINSSDKTAREEVKKNMAAIQRLIGAKNYLFVLREFGEYSFR